MIFCQCVPLSPTFYFDTIQFALLFRKGSLRAGAKPRITDSPFVRSFVRSFVCVLTGIEIKVVGQTVQA